MNSDALAGLSRLEANTEAHEDISEAKTSFAFSKLEWKKEPDEEGRNYSYVCDRKRSNISVFPVQTYGLRKENAVEVLAPFVTGLLPQMEAQGQGSDIIGFTIFHKPANSMNEEKIRVFFADAVVLSQRDQFMCLGYKHPVREAFPVEVAKQLLKTYNTDAPRWHPLGVFDEQNKRNIELALEKHPDAKTVVRYVDPTDWKSGPQRQTVAAVEDADYSDAYVVHRRSGQIVGWKGRLAVPACF